MAAAPTGGCVEDVCGNAEAAAMLVPPGIE